ncbi:MAG: ThuA domain-containing protein [Pseudomonadota bacterium]
MFKIRNVAVGFVALMTSGAVFAAAAPVTRADPVTRAPPFKGTWQGPTRTILPGPGPKAGQELADYFANLVSGDRRPVKLHVLALGGTRGFHHDSVSATMNAIGEAGRRTGLWITEFSTGFELINARGGKPMHAGFQPVGLYDFDVVVVAGASGDWGLTAEQKAALLAYVHDGGKGVVVIHAGMDANHGWRDYLDMIGAEMQGHPFNTLEKVVRSFALINESPDFPAVRHLPKQFSKQDELYVVRNWSRSDVNVLLRLDATRLDYNEYPDLETQIPPDHDFPIAWTKRYGKGRVFVSSIGHPAEAFDDPDIVQMYTEAVKWALGLTEGDERPHAQRN